MNFADLMALFAEAIKSYLSTLEEIFDFLAELKKLA